MSVHCNQYQIFMANIFDTKLREFEEPELPLDPIELYQSCAYKEGFGYLRAVQEEVLTTWHANRNQRDTIFKMNTGSGKTLTGLLALYSKLIETGKPTLYVCPDHQLVEQTVFMSRDYGIPICEFDEFDFPTDFLNGKKILICTFQKLFNGRTIFNKHRINIGAIVIDDAHKCVDIARDQCILKIHRQAKYKKQIVLWNKLVDIFEPALKAQQPGSYNRIIQGDPTVSLRIPYWTWMDNHSLIISLLNGYISDPDTEDKYSQFRWDIMADNLLSYDCFLNSDTIEISPIHVPYHFFQSFNNAEHRFILTATLEDDFDLIKDLGISLETVKAPIIPKDRRDIGKRLILAPNRFVPSISDDEIRDFISSYIHENLNIVILCPSFMLAEQWAEYGATVIDKDSIEAALEKLKISKGNFFVFSNRYDGIDLNGDMCRILVLDGFPRYSSMQEYYAETRLETLKAARKAQIIEQGLGRGVRSGGDYCVVFLMNLDLVSFLAYKKNLSYFSPVTRKQIELGLTLLDNENKSDAFSVLRNTANFCLTQHESWIKVHSGTLAKASPENSSEKKMERLEITDIERRALEEFRSRRYANAASIIDHEIIPIESLSKKEQAWYFQLAAQLLYMGDPVKSNSLQDKAYRMTTDMFHPKDGYSPKKVSQKNSQPAVVKKNLEKFTLPQDILIGINEILQYLRYIPEIPAKDFENSLAALGKFLGFKSQQCEQEMADGPDVLWSMNDQHYLILEAKSQATHPEISRDNISQLLHSEQWFKNTYGEGLEYTSVTLQKAGSKGKAVSISDNMKVLDESALDLLHENLLRFGTALQTLNIHGFSEEDVLALLVTYKLTPSLFRATYLKKIK